MEKSVSQSDLSKSVAWKNYKAIHEKIEKVKSIAPIEKLQDQAGDMQAPLEDLFKGDTSLSKDLVALLDRKLRTKYDTFRSKPGRRPKPDYEKAVTSNHWIISLKFRIVNAFNVWNIKDDLIQSYSDGLPQDIVNLRHSMEVAAKKRILHPVPDDQKNLPDLAAIETDLKKMEASIAAWRKNE